MISHTTRAFRKLYAALPEQVQQQAKQAYRRFRSDPQHPSLQFKQVHPTKPVFSARISLDYRTIGIKDGNEIVWFWIGSHSEYDKILARL